MAWVEILPGYEAHFRRRGWDSAAPFLAWTGILVNQHRQRQVEQVTLPSPLRGRGAGGEGAETPEADIPSPPVPLPQGARGESYYLKKQSAVSWHELFRNAWHGFGWCSTAVREAAMLQALRQAGIGCPEVAALGEDGRQAFVLLRDESDMTELRTLLPTLAEIERHRLAEALGRALAKMHDAGFDHPDLFAKHILAAHESQRYRFCILDWQRGRRRRVVSWTQRCRNLAVLDATLHELLSSDRMRVRCLRAYWRAASTQDRPPLGRLARLIRLEADRLGGRRGIREVCQLAVPARSQQFVPLRAGRLLVVRSYYEDHDEQLPAWLTKLSEPEASAKMDDRHFAHASGSEDIVLSTWENPSSTWDIPPLAHTLFRLQRFGVPAPRLLAVGCTTTQVFLAAASVPSVPFEEALAKATISRRACLLQEAGAIVRRIHDAGYSLPVGDTWARRLGVVRATGLVVLAKADPLPACSASWQELAPREFNRQKIRLSRADQLRFLRGYLGRRHRAWEEAVLARAGAAGERRAAA